MRLSAFPILGLLVVVAACGSGTSNADLTPNPTAQTLKNVPKWFMDVPKDPDYLLAAATATSTDMQLASKKAEAEALSQVARQLAVKFDGLQKRFQEETGLSDDSESLDQFTVAYKAVISQEMYGTRIARRAMQREGEVFRSYVLMEMPIGQANQELMSKIRANQNLYTRFRATEAYKELDKEIEKYEAWKRKQDIK